MSTAAPASPPGSSSSATCPVESFTYDDRVVRWFAAATLAWGLLATLAGIMIGVLLVMPGLAEGQPSFAFGRLRSIHTSTALFAFIANAVFTAIYFTTQRLCQTRLLSHTLGMLHFWSWQAIIGLSVIGYPLGIMQAKRFAEMEWPLDIAVAIIWILFFGINFFGTLLRRRERRMYISLWFYITTVIAVPIVHIGNNLVVPLSLTQSVPWFSGVPDALLQWWYGHHVLTFLLTMPFLGFMYYFLPKVAERPLYSYRVGIIHFWSVFLLAIWAAPRGLHYTTIPEWLSTLGMLSGFLLWMPSWAGVFNWMLTLRGSWHRVAADPILKFLVVAIALYGFTSFEAAWLSIKSIYAVGQYSDWTIAHRHTGALGWNGFLIFGMAYWLLPRVYRTQLWSEKLMSLHFWTGTIGILLYILPIYAAGIMQSYMWRAMDETGSLLYPDFVQTLEAIVPLWWLRVVGGILYTAGLVVLAINAVMTGHTRSTARSQPVFTAARSAIDFEPPAPMPASHLAGAPVLEFGKKLDVWSRLAWHRDWERKPIAFALLITMLILIAAAAEILPVFLLPSNVPKIAAIEPYTPLELAGREIYLAEGCHNCHSQQVRPLVPETKRYGEYSEGGEFVYDRPALWGNRRIGPDLAREGGKNTSYWHWTHLDDPSQVSPSSVMPSFRHLLQDDLDFASIAPLLTAAHQLGAPYEQDMLEDFEDHARRQAEVVTAEIVTQGGPAAVFDKQAIALIAYLQRLGTDRFRATAQPAENETATDSGPAENEQTEEPGNE